MFKAISHNSTFKKNLFSRRIHTKLSLPDLPYTHNALEPVISEEIMTLHHKKHHQTYVDNANKAIDKLSNAISSNDTTTILSQQSALNFNLGGHINHSIFWQNLAPRGEGGKPSEQLLREINSTFGGMEAMKTIFTQNTLAIQGSGWGWLGWCPNDNRLMYAQTKDQDSLVSTHGLVPLLGVDVWEHAYYLQYRNLRVEYLKAIWSIVNWEDVSSRLATIKKA